MGAVRILGDRATPRAAIQLLMTEVVTLAVQVAMVARDWSRTSMVYVTAHDTLGGPHVLQAPE
jgi:hypothetical protein